jgi:hypothetical protein
VPQLTPHDSVALHLPSTHHNSLLKQQPLAFQHTNKLRGIVFLETHAQADLPMSQLWGASVYHNAWSQTVCDWVTPRPDSVVHTFSVPQQHRHRTVQHRHATSTYPEQAACHTTPLMVKAAHGCAGVTCYHQHTDAPHHHSQQPHRSCVNPARQGASHLWQGTTSEFPHQQPHQQQPTGDVATIKDRKCCFQSQTAENHRGTVHKRTKLGRTAQHSMTQHSSLQTFTLAGLQCSSRYLCGDIQLS